MTRGLERPVREKLVAQGPLGQGITSYRSPGEHGEFDIFSLGADGQQGGEGKNADITSWE